MSLHDNTKAQIACYEAIMPLLGDDNIWGKDVTDGIRIQTAIYQILSIAAAGLIEIGVPMEQFQDDLSRICERAWSAREIARKVKK